MEENEKEKVEVEANENVGAATESTENATQVNDAKVNAAKAAVAGAALKLGILKNKKRLIICIIAVVVAFVAIYNIFFNMEGKAKSTIKNYLTALGNGKYTKAMKEIDPVGKEVFSKLDKEEYEDFWKEYKEFKKSDDYDDLKEEWKEQEEMAKDLEEDFDKDEKATIKVKKITKFKKVGDHLYEVKAKIEIKSDGDEDEDTYTFYVMKSGLSCKLVKAPF